MLFLFLHHREKYLNTLLQVEMMLKLWFPQILTQPVSTASSVATSPARSLQEASGSTPPHKHRDQLHIPVKVRTYIPDFLLLIHINISPPHQHHKFYKNLPFIFWKLLSCLFSRSADLAGRVQTLPRLPLYLSSPPISAQEKTGWSLIAEKVDLLPPHH